MWRCFLIWRQYHLDDDCRISRERASNRLRNQAVCFFLKETSCR
nr:MAG TPA: hypothetical protein [Caudoviricetes sp.]